MDIVERLRSVGGIEGTTRWYINPDGPEAADEIERLREDKEMWADATAKAQQEIESLRKALKEIDGQVNNGPDYYTGIDSYRVGVVRRIIARAALKGDEWELTLWGRW